VWHADIPNAAVAAGNLTTLVPTDTIGVAGASLVVWVATAEVAAAERVTVYVMAAEARAVEKIPGAVEGRVAF
jgi:hypothetical protein